MDQELLRQAYQDLNDCCCAYDEAILARYCECSKAVHFYIAEREGINCQSPPAQARCLGFLTLLRHNARFAIKTLANQPAIPHSKLLKLQVGGLRGLRTALESAGYKTATTNNIYDLLDQAIACFGAINLSVGDDTHTSSSNLPLQTIIQHIAAFKGHEHRRRRH